MDWARLRRRIAKSHKPDGVYANLDDLIRLQFKARDFSLLPEQPVNSILSGRYASRLRGRGLNFEELRRYQPGDDIRTMDWKVTARTRTPHVRVYTEEKDRAVLLVVDQRANMFFGTRKRMKSVTAAEVAALGAWRAVDVGDRVGAIVFNDEDIVEVKPARSQGGVLSILGTILEMNHALSGESGQSSNPAMLNSALQKAVHLAPHDVLVVVISDFDGVDRNTERLTARLAAHNDILGILVHDPVRISPPSERITVSDGSLQMELDLGKSSVRDKVVNDYQKEQEGIQRYLRRLSAPLLTLSNEGDVVDQVRALLGVQRGTGNG